ncbi:MAG: bacteriohemerythrin [Geothrix sp.]|nr:bacteriohemerythrin [Geothrix sp.]
MAFTWSSAEHAIGVSVFDEEHQRLAALMSQVHTALKEKEDRVLAQNLMGALIYETWVHFDHEERVMEEVGFSERDAHAAEHAALIQQAKEMLQKVQRGDISPQAMPDFLMTWLMSHVQITDRRYAECMQQRGYR